MWNEKVLHHQFIQCFRVMFLLLHHHLSQSHHFLSVLVTNPLGTNQSLLLNCVIWQKHWMWSIIYLCNNLKTYCASLSVLWFLNLVHHLLPYFCLKKKWTGFARASNVSTFFCSFNNVKCETKPNSKWIKRINLHLIHSGQIFVSLALNLGTSLKSFMRLRNIVWAAFWKDEADFQRKCVFALKVFQIKTEIEYEWKIHN